MGGKFKSIKNLLPEFPHTKIFVDVFGGGGNVVYNIEPRSVMVYNDINRNVVNFFQVCREQPEELARLIEYTPFSRYEHEQAWDKMSGGEIEPLEWARCFVVGLFQNFGRKTSGRAGWAYSKNSSNILSFNNFHNKIKHIAHKFRRIHIENQDYSKVIRKYDNKETLLYLDPPYLSTAGYAAKFGEKEHIELLDMIKESKGLVAISGYDSELYNDYLQGWHKKEWHSKSTIKSDTNAKPTKDCLWMNYENGILGHYERISL